MTDLSVLQSGPEQDRPELLAFLKERALQFGNFTLTSGKTSSYYFDGKQVTLYPKGACLLGKVIIEKIRGDSVQALGGLTIGADPIVGAVAALAYPLGLDIKTFIVRKEAKKHGKQKLIEGPALNPGDRVVIVEDVITTGGSALKAIEAVQGEGGQVVKVVPLVDRLEGGAARIEETGIKVDPVFTARDFGISIPG